MVNGNTPLRNCAVEMSLKIDDVVIGSILNNGVCDVLW